MRRLLACTLFAGLASPAVACINDCELRTHEREFRSQYNGPPAPAPETEYPNYTRDRLLLWGGGVLLAGSVALSLFGRKAGG